MSSLAERLRELADDAPYAPGDPGLYDRARAYHRRRRTGSLVAAVLVLVLLGAAAGAAELSARPSVDVAGGTRALGVPDRLWEPSPWLPAEGSRSLGVLAAVIPAVRNSWAGESRQVVGVSASTGEYRFLDLPGLVQDAAASGRVALSPDGRQVAYFISGPTSGSANTSEGGDAPAAGVAMRDTVTGDVTTHLVETEHGIAPYALTWAGPEEVVLSFGQYLGGDGDEGGDRATSAGAELLRWQVGGLRPVQIRDSNNVLRGAGGGQVVVSFNGSVGVVDARTGALNASVAWRRAGSPGRLVPDAEGTRLAAVPGQRPGDVSVADLAAADGRPPRLRPVPGSGPVSSVLSWIDGDHLAVTDAEQRLSSLDVRTGERTRLVELPAGPVQQQDRLATDLLPGTIPGIEPQRPWSPRVTAGAGLFGAALVIGALNVWRRRVRP